MHRLLAINGPSLFKKIWNENKISQKTLLECIAVPLVLTSLVLAVKLWVFPANLSPPYLFFFAVIMISACYGGGRAAIFASGDYFYSRSFFIISSRFNFQPCYRKANYSVYRFFN